MNARIVQAVIKLRRDNDYNYQKNGDKFIPANGEVCLVDTARKGLCAVIGDGKTTFNKLEYVNNIFEYGYFFEGKWYKDQEHTEEVQLNENKIYIDRGILYYFDGKSLQQISSGELPTASAEIAGVMKLYSTIGANTDGTMTQKAITDELSEKFEMDVDMENETIIFAKDI